MSDLNELAQKVRDLEHWKHGNGGRGAEQRLQDVEARSQTIQHNCCAELCQKNAAEVEDLKDRMIRAEHAQEGFVNAETMNEIVKKARDGFIQAMRAERKKTTEVLKALAPYFVAICGALIAIFTRGA